MRESRASRLVSVLIAPVVVAVSVLIAVPASAAEPSACDDAHPYVLLTDPTGVATDALCREQEKVLHDLSEVQWGEPYTTQQRARILAWAPDQALGALYIDLLRIANLSASERTADEAAIYLWFQQAIAGLRTRLANAAYAEQIEYANNPCDYTPPGPDAQKWTECDTSMLLLFGGPPSPTYEDFVNFGALRALGEELPGTQATRAVAADQAARTQALAAYAGAAGGAVFSGAVLGLLATGATSSIASLVLSGVTTSTTIIAAGASAISTFVVGAAIAVAAVVVCIVLAVVRGVAVFTEAEIPGKLRDDITNAGTLVDVASWLNASDGNNFIGLTALAGRITTETAPSAPVPATPSGESPTFLVTGGGQPAQFGPTLQYVSPLVPDAVVTTWLDHGWWVVKDVDGNLAMTHVLQFTDHDGENRSAIATQDGFLLYATGASDIDECDADNKCEQTTSLPFMEPLTGNIAAVQRTATLAGSAIDFTSLPTVASTYEVGDTLDVQAAAQASYPATMTYQWQLIHHAGGADVTDVEPAARMYRKLTMPGDYTLTVTASANSGEVGTHSWDFTVTGEPEGQLVQNILVTQYADDSTDGTPPLLPGPWIEGSTHGALCVSTGSTDPTDYTVKFFGSSAMVKEGVTDGVACFQRPAGASQAGVHPLETVNACPVDGLCLPPLIVDPVKGITTSVFTYEVTNEPGTVANPSVGVQGETLATTGIFTPQSFVVGDTVEMRAAVTDPGGAAQDVTVTWSDGASQTLPAVASGDVVTVTHTFAHSAFSPVGAQIIATDAVGVTSNLATAWFSVLPPPAGVSLHATADAAGRVTLTGGLTDPEKGTSNVAIEWGDGEHTVLGAPSTSLAGSAQFPSADLVFDASHVYADSADHTITVTAYNGAATNGTATTTVSLPASAPAVAVSNPITVADDGTATLSATVGDHTPGDELSLIVDYGDGDTARVDSLAAGDEVPLSHTYAPGQYTLTLVAADADGLNSPIVMQCLVAGATADSAPCPNTIPATDIDLTALPPGPVDGPAQAHPGDTVTMTAGTVAEGDVVFGYLYSTPVAIGTYVAQAGGTGALTIPAATEPGAHLIALFSGGQLVGYAPITVVPADAGTGGTGADGSGSGGTGSDGSGSDGSDSGSQGTLSGTGANAAAEMTLVALLFAFGGALLFAGRRRRGSAA